MRVGITLVWLETVEGWMNQAATQKLEVFYGQSVAAGRSALLDMEEISAGKGELLIPAVKEVNLALMLSDYRASWRDSLGLRSKRFSAGIVSLCHFNQPVRFELEDPVDFAVVVLRNQALEQAREETRQCLGADLQAQPLIEDPTLRGLMEILHREKHDGLQNGSFFLDSLAVALASLLVRKYSNTPRAERKFAGGMAPSMLRRSIDFMEAHLEGDLRLSDVAREVGLSASHFIRSFRESTGKTPHQFLLHRRVERARSLMRDRRAPLTEVALASGFADQHHMARIFRRITRMTPSSYRRLL
jgi:AraC family transcriptional regulator